MLTFPNIFNNLIGVFPNVFAKNASGAGSTDGTEYKKTVVDELFFGWLQRAFVEVGQTPNGVPETSSVSQIFDVMREAFNTPEFQQIGASGPVVFGKTNHQIELDVSVGNVDIDALSLSDFIGQHVHFYAVGSGIGSIAGGNGVYVNDIFITENTGGAHGWGVSGGLWKFDNGITADYASGSDIVKQTSAGNLIILFNISGVANTLVSNYFGSTSGAVYSVIFGSTSFPVAFQSIPKFTTGHVTVQTRNSIAAPTSSTTGGITLYAGGLSGLSVSSEFRFTGEY